jgi:Hg(II)-responsive transcriptional regulator
MRAMTHEQYSIGALAEAADTKVETVRYYERIGLLPEPGRTRGNYRSYSGDHLARLGFIRRARELGFTLDQIRALLGLADHRENDCRAVDALASEHLAGIEQKIADLNALRRELGDLIGQCKQGKIADCRIIGALSPGRTITEQ